MTKDQRQHQHLHQHQHNAMRYSVISRGDVPQRPRLLTKPLLERTTEWGVSRSGVAEYGKRACTEVRTIRARSAFGRGLSFCARESLSETFQGLSFRGVPPTVFYESSRRSERRTGTAPLKRKQSVS